MSSQWIGRELAVTETGETVDRKTRRDLQTGELISEDRPSPYKVGVDVPAVGHIGSGVDNDKRWQEIIERKQEKWAEQQAEQQADMDALGVGTPQAATQLVKDEAEARMRADHGRKTYGGLGGLLGPNGTLARRARGEEN